MGGYETQEQAVEALDSIGEGAVYVVSALILALQDQDAEVRRGMGIG